MKIFFDTEFTGLHQHTTLISIGLVAEDGRYFYGEIIDYAEHQVDEWIHENVIENLKFKGQLGFNSPDYKTNNYSFEMCDYKERVSSELRRWLNQFDKVEWVSDVCHYDFVLLIDLLYGHALNMPYGVLNAACHDINQDIAKRYGVDEIKAFDMSREDILDDAGIYVDGEKHNALYDAYVIKAIYDRCKMA